MNRIWVASLLVFGVTGTAAADRRMGPQVDDGRGRVKTYVLVDPPTPGTTIGTGVPANLSHVIYLNNCRPNGCNLTPGDNGPNSESSIINSAVHINALSATANWDSIVQCIKDTYAPFNVQFVTDRPQGNYHTAIIAGRPTEGGFDANTAGVSPFDPNGCSYLPNAISFTFGNLNPTDVADLCWTASQETAHSWGLDHKFDNRDPQTYLYTGPTFKRFQNEAGACGEDGARACTCSYPGTGASKMNSYALIMSTFGSSAPDTVPPTVVISAPVDGAVVQAKFAVRATPDDNIGISKAELRIDGTLINTVYAFPYVWNAPATLTMGAHKVEVTAYDIMGNTAKDTVNVVFGTKCTKPADCTAAGDTCVDGRCVAGAGEPGGLGSVCAGNGDCKSDQCASDDTGSFCVEPCDPSVQGCPSGFGCVETGPGAGVCFPGADAGGGGCNTSSSSGLMVLALAFGAVLITRRRRT